MVILFLASPSQLFRLGSLPLLY
uniref:Uncharacterized protein n=1 Tax=Rhizophora mucronata TaxID=61149 RepID=A0A2P2QY03_RHIMU